MDLIRYAGFHRNTIKNTKNRERRNDKRNLNNFFIAITVQAKFKEKNKVEASQFNTFMG